MSLLVLGANLIVSIKSFYREKTAVFFRIAFPVLLILVFGTIFMDNDNRSFDLHVQDLDQTKASAQLIKTIELSGRFRIAAIAPAINATQYAKDHKTNLVLSIPKGFEGASAQRVALGDPDSSVTLTIIHDPSSAAAATKMQASVAVSSVNC